MALNDNCIHLYNNYDDEAGEYNGYCSAYKKDIKTCGEYCPRYDIEKQQGNRNKI